MESPSKFKFNLIISGLTQIFYCFSQLLIDSFLFAIFIGIIMVSYQKYHFQQRVIYNEKTSLFYYFVYIIIIYAFTTKQMKRLECKTRNKLLQINQTNKSYQLSYNDTIEIKRETINFTQFSFNNDGFKKNLDLKNKQIKSRDEKACSNINNLKNKLLPLVSLANFHPKNVQNKKNKQERRRRFLSEVASIQTKMQKKKTKQKNIFRINNICLVDLNGQLKQIHQSKKHSFNIELNRTLSHEQKQQKRTCYPYIKLKKNKNQYKKMKLINLESKIFF